MNIGTVVEGPTDRPVIEAVINEFCPRRHRFFPLQPLDSPTFGRTGAGWKGVREWCRLLSQMEGSSLAQFVSGDVGPPLDRLP
jgi:hypothetical protein